MTNYSEIIVAWLMLPVVMQIIFPLLIFAGFMLLRALRAVTGIGKISRPVKEIG